MCDWQSILRRRTGQKVEGTGLPKVSAKVQLITSKVMSGLEVREEGTKYKVPTL